MSPFLFLICGCAGPTTPLGAVWTFTPAKAHTLDGQALARTLASSDSGTNQMAPKIQIAPSRQVLHGPSPMKIIIKDPTGDLNQYQLSVRYNGFDVSSSFIRQSSLIQHWNERVIILEKPKVFLSDSKEHLIEFIYKNSLGVHAYARFEPPTCYAFRQKPVVTTGGFRPPTLLVSKIEKASQEEGFNPAFFTALVAQESSFNPKLVSWAKAVGLTQVTPIAEEEIAEIHGSWPRYPGANKISAAQLKFLVASGRINEDNEWRLDPALSIQGGVTYAKMIAEKWSTPERLARIKIMFTDPEIAHSELILASYHSGFTRVMNALNAYGKDWLRSPDLKEARKYVTRIFSYCSYFAEGEIENARAS